MPIAENACFHGPVMDMPWVRQEKWKKKSEGKKEENERGDFFKNMSSEPWLA